jgi:PmbA protein
MRPTASRRPKDLVDAVTRLETGWSADARLVREGWTTIRFANGRIHQPHYDSATLVSYRAAHDGRLATATTVDASPEGLGSVAAIAQGLADVAPREKKFRGFPAGRGRPPRPVAYSRTTARITPERAVRIAEEILDAAERDAPGARIAGAVNVGSESLRVVNSSGLDRSTQTSVVQASVLVDRPDRDPPVSAWSEGGHWDAARLDAGRLGSEAARLPRDAPVSVEPGKYRVILRGPAMAELLGFLGHLGFAGRGEEEGWSCLKGKRGKRVAPALVTLVDDPRSRETVPMAIDYEGTSTRSLALVREGIAGPATTDLVTSSRLGRPLTGHAPPPEAPAGAAGPTPSHLLLTAGDATEEELVRETRRGLLVTRFHYVRVVDPGRGVITGMTRDGTYRIEHGEIVGPAKNLRFTESVVTALRGIELLGKERRIYPSERGGSVATTPDALLGTFEFTSATLF